MTVLFESPWPFSERILLYGGGGSGKTNSILNIALHVSSQLHVVEADISQSYERGLATDFEEATDRVHIWPMDDWATCLEALETAIDVADPEEDWLAIDSASPCTYSWVQDWTMEQMYQNDLPHMLMELRHKHADDSKEFFAAKSDLMQWDIVKKEYAKFWRLLGSWRGNLIMTAEAKQIYRDALKKDPEAKMLYGVLGVYPDGQSQIRHAMSTTLFMDHPETWEWRYTTIKDRNREPQDKKNIEEFAVDYLANVAGWTRIRKGRK